MTGSGAGPWLVLKQAARRVRTEASISVALTVIAVAPAVLLLGWVVGESWGVRTAAPLALLVVALMIAGVLLTVLIRRWVVPLTDAAIIAAAERARGLPEGSLRGVVDLSHGLPPGVSGALFRKTERELARGLEGTAARDLVGDVGERARTRRRRSLGIVAGLAFLTVAAAFGTPERARAGWTPLLHPVAHVRGPALAPLSVTPGNAAVPRGAVLSVEVTAPYRAQVTLEWQASGDVPRRDRLAVRDDRANGAIGPVEAEVTYRVRAPDGAVSGPYYVRPTDPLLLAGLGIELVYPRYLAREPERIEGEAASLSLPEGTVLRVRGRATRSLEAAAFQRAGGAERVGTTDGPAFSMDWRVVRGDAGLWELVLRDEDGTDAVGTTLRVAIEPDAPPRVRVVVPGGDTLMPPTLRQPIVADAVDDHGLVAAALVYRRIGAAGQRGREVRTELDLPPGQRRAVIQGVLDATAQSVAAGDAIEYHVEVRDNAPGGQIGRSSTYLLRLPSMALLRDQARRSASDLLADMERTVVRSRELDRATRDLARRGSRGGPAPTRQRGASPSEASMLEFERASELNRLAADHEDLSGQVRALQERLEQLRDAIDRAGLRDADLHRRLDELRELQHSLSPDDRERATEALRAAAEALDPEAAVAAIAELMRRQDEIDQLMDESLALLQQAVVDQEMAALAREAQEIAAEQELLASTMREELGSGPTAASEALESADTGDAESPAVADAGDPDAPRADGADGDGARGEDQGDGGAEGGNDAGERRAGQQEELGERTRRLTGLLESLQRQLLQMGDSESASQAGSAREKGESAQEAMQDAADQARQADGDAAAQSGERAAGDVAAAAQALEEARGGRGQARQAQLQRAVEEATQDALRLAEREEALRQQMVDAERGGGSPGAQQGGSLQDMQSEQVAVRQGLEQLGRNLTEATREAGPMDREVGQALARAMLDMDRTLEGLQAAPGRMPVREAERTVESLNRLAMALLDQDTRNRQPGNPALDQALQRLAQLAREQAALNAQVGAFAPLDVPSRAQEDQIRNMAEAQRGIARRAGEVSGMLGGREDILGRVDELAIEASAIARQLEGGRLDADTRARQERLFHRLLDAGRSLEREEYTDERVGEVASRRDAAEPPALDPGLLDSGLPYPGPTAEQLRGLPAAYRRLVLEYFDRLNTGGDSVEAPTPEGGRP